MTAYFTEHPDPAEPSQQVAFGTSGHRGSALRLSFNEDHIAATTQAICEHRAAAGHHRADLHGPRHARAVRARDGHRAGGAGRQRRGDPDRQPGRLHARRPRCPARSSPTTTAARRPGRRDRRHARRTTRRRTAASSTTRPTAARPARRSPRPSSSAPTSSLAGGLRDVQRIPLARARAAAGRFDFLGEYVAALPLGRRHGGDPGRQGADRRRPARRRERRATGARSPSGTSSS